MKITNSLPQISPSLKENIRTNYTQTYKFKYNYICDNVFD